MKTLNKENQIIGIMDSYFDENDCYCTVNSFYVKPTEQNKGIGSLLVKQLLEKTEKLRIDRIWIGFFIENQNTFQIYKRFNYIETKKEMIKIESKEYEYSHGYFKTKHLKMKFN
eukprot:gene10690-3311_t